MEWSQKKSLELIGLYEQHPELWNQKHEFYFSKSKRAEAWKLIDEKLKFTMAGDSKKKIDSLLASFRREKGKRKLWLESGKGWAENYVSKWFAFPSLAFLLDRDESKTASDPLAEVEIEDDSSELQYVKVENAEFDEAALSTSEESDNNYESLTDFRPSSHQSVAERSASSEKRRKLCNSSATFRNTSENSKVDEVLRLLKDVIPSTKTETDGCAVFGQHVCLKLRSYDKDVQNIVQHHINNILYNADMGIYEAATARKMLRK